MTTWQATRSLTSEDGRAVEVSIGVPEPDGDSWRCDARIVVDGTSAVTPWKGRDAFEALQQALTSVWSEVTALGCKQSPDLPAKSHGFYRPVPIEPLLHNADAFNAMLDARLADHDALPADKARLKAMGRAFAAKGPPPSPGGG